MATPIPTERRQQLRTSARQLAAKGMSQRAISRELKVHHNTVKRLLDEHEPPGAPPAEPASHDRATDGEPHSEPDRATSEPPAPTSGDTTAPPAHPATELALHPRLFADLRDVIDAETGDLPEPLARAIHHAATQVRARWRATDRATEKDTA